MFAFWAGQSLKLSRNTCFRGFKSSLAVNSRVAKTWKVGILKIVKFRLLSFKRRSYDNYFWPINLGDLIKILGAWNVLSSAFLLKKRFLKIQLLVAWLKCLLILLIYTNHKNSKIKSWTDPVAHKSWMSPVAFWDFHWSNKHTN